LESSEPERIRQKRLAFFDKNSAEKTSVDQVLQKKPETRKPLIQDLHSEKNPNYDYPKCPPRPVSPKSKSTEVSRDTQPIHSNTQLINEINKLVDDEFESIMKESEMEMERKKAPRMQTAKLRQNKPISKPQKQEDSSDYEEVCYKVKSALDTKNSDNIVKITSDKPVRPLRGKQLKKAVSLDAESSTGSTPSFQITDRPSEKLQNQRFRSTSGDQVILKHSVINIMNRNDMLNRGDEI